MPELDLDPRRMDTALTDEEEDDGDIATLPGAQEAVAEERELTTNSDAVDGVLNDSDLGASTGYTDIREPRETAPAGNTEAGDEMEIGGEGI